MESPVAKAGRLGRSIAGRQKKTDLISGVAGVGSTILAFLGGQKDKFDTAWGEYEKGYKALGGDPGDIPERPGFLKQSLQTILPGGKKGFFERPEGEVRIGETMYNREDISNVGSFLGSDSATVLFAGERGDKIREDYLKRTAPGTLATGQNLADYMKEQAEVKTTGGGSIYGRTQRKFPKSTLGRYPEGGVQGPPEKIISAEESAANAAKLEEARFQDFQNQLAMRRQEQIDRERRTASDRTNYEIKQDELLESYRADGGFGPMKGLQAQIDEKLLKGPQFSKRQQRKMDTALGKWQQGSDPTMDYSSLGIEMSGAEYDKTVKKAQEDYYLRDVEDNPYRTLTKSANETYEDQW